VGNLQRRVEAVVRQGSVERKVPEQVEHAADGFSHAKARRGTSRRADHGKQESLERHEVDEERERRQQDRYDSRGGGEDDQRWHRLVEQAE